MNNIKNDLGEFISTVHNPECVVEVYLDRDKDEINELKCLNQNRYKVYNYSITEYAEHIRRYNLVIPSLS
ncbi:hypothetical protein [Crocinitomix catalasitica]|uniref:hypothetical protein n=1 Tax=Crocinitomix catalasitica TaxID=184607 RepID=UPI0012F7D265|nr:hypothetical protein [Crocinitomix catalasitica]